MANNIIEVRSLTKSFGNVHAVNKINFDVHEGSLFAFLGENGAGKSTTINMLCTLLKPDSGTVVIGDNQLGIDDEKIRNLIGIVFQDNLLDDLLTVRENLEVRGSFYGLTKSELKTAVQNAAEITGSMEFLNRPYGKLSGGQRRRADIARALLHTPRVLFLDEPTTGLDPQTRKIVWETVRNLQRENKMTVFLTTHYMEEAAQADYITIMGHGNILASGTPIELKQQFSNDILRIKPKNQADFIQTCSNGSISFFKKGEYFQINLSSTLEAMEILKLFEDNLLNFEVLNGTMDDVFMNVVGGEVL